MSSSKLPLRLLIAAGTYDGVLAGWETSTEQDELQLTFATPVHEGSIRHLCMSAACSQKNQPGTLLTCGYDETLKTHDCQKRLTSSGEVRTPADFGTPSCVSFCPPPSSLENNTNSTHCMVGFANGKLVLYKKRDWSIQHVLGGHEGGVAALSVHPSGKMALSGGQSDGKLKLWDLTRGRLAHADKVSGEEEISSLVWSRDGQAYAWAHGNHVTVRQVASSTGKDLLNIQLPSRVNQIVLIKKEENLFVAAACNDGSLPVLLAQDTQEEERRAIMAIEPVDSIVAGEERFKCIQHIRGFLVATANSAGVVSVMDLSGAIKMVMEDDSNEEEEEKEGDESGSDDGVNSEEEGEEEELAVDILAGVRLGTGARITSLAVWSSDIDVQEEADKVVEGQQEEAAHNEHVAEDENQRGLKRKAEADEIDEQAMEKARALVHQAKKLKSKKEKKKSKKKKKQGVK